MASDIRRSAGRHGLTRPASTPGSYPLLAPLSSGDDRRNDFPARDAQDVEYRRSDWSHFVVGRQLGRVRSVNLRSRRGHDDEGRALTGPPLVQERLRRCTATFRKSVGSQVRRCSGGQNLAPIRSAVHAYIQREILRAFHPRRQRALLRRDVLRHRTSGYRARSARAPCRPACPCHRPRWRCRRPGRVGHVAGRAGINDVAVGAIGVDLLQPGGAC